MVNRHFLIAATASVALFSGVAGAFAQPPGPPQFGGPQFTNAQPPQGQQGPGGRGGQRQGDPALRGQRLHQQLNITPNQEQAFNAWIAATAAPAGPPNDQGTTTPQKLDRRLADLTARVNAAKRFYGVLTPEQKQIVDGLPSEVAGFKTRCVHTGIEGEDTLTAALKFPSGALGTIGNAASQAAYMQWLKNNPQAGG